MYIHFTSAATLLIVYQLSVLGTLNIALSLTTLLRLSVLDFNRLWASCFLHKQQRSLAHSSLVFLYFLSSILLFISSGTTSSSPTATGLSPSAAGTALSPSLTTSPGIQTSALAGGTSPQPSPGIQTVSLPVSRPTTVYESSAVMMIYLRWR